MSRNRHERGALNEQSRHVEGGETAPTATPIAGTFSRSVRGRRSSSRSPSWSRTLASLSWVPLDVQRSCSVHQSGRAPGPETPERPQGLIGRTAVSYTDSATIGAGPAMLGPPLQFRRPAPRCFDDTQSSARTVRIAARETGERHRAENPSLSSSVKLPMLIASSPTARATTSTESRRAPPGDRIGTVGLG